MEKQEYISNRFKRDFLQYSLLQDDTLSTSAIAEKIYGSVSLAGVIDDAKREIDALCDKYLSFEKVKTGGKLSNELSEELSFDLKDKIIAEFAEYLKNRDVQTVVASILGKIERVVERQAWSNGIANMSEAVKLLVERIAGAAKAYGNLYTRPISEEELLTKYNNAKENTFLERLQGNNSDDIIAYRNALIAYVRANCENMLYAKVQEVYRAIAAHEAIDKWQANFEEMANYANGLRASIVDSESCEEWDKEYNRLVPTDFYYRNVENITAEQAFHMVLLQFFAKNEDWMLENGLLVDGELHFFTGTQNLTTLVAKLEDIVTF